MFTERILWYSLRGAQLDGRKFTRQKGIGPYIVDFYCAEEKLAIELDGSVHEDPNVQARDQARQVYLESMGVRVIRFTNEEFLENGDAVIASIRSSWAGRERASIVRPERARKKRAPEHSANPAAPPPSPLLFHSVPEEGE